MLIFRDTPVQHVGERVGFWNKTTTFEIPRKPLRGVPRYLFGAGPVAVLKTSRSRGIFITR